MIMGIIIGVELKRGYEYGSHYSQALAIFVYFCWVSRGIFNTMLPLLECDV